MYWVSVDDQSPEAAGVYMVLRHLNRYPTSRYFHPSVGWNSNDRVLYWRPMPPPPEGYDYPHDAISG